MIGYYVHHQGRGHSSRAVAIAARLGRDVTGLSSSPRPDGWPGEWIVLPRDDGPAADLGSGGVASDAPDAGGALHWAPLRHEGFRQRSANISEWIERTRPAAMVVDVSVEVALLARLHGVPVVSVVLPGERSDGPHRLGFGVSSALVAAWPPAATGMVSGLSASDAGRVEAVGAISRRPPSTSALGSSATGRRVLVLGGAGGGGADEQALQRARAETPDWHWDVVGGTSGRWVEDPWPLIVAADVVVAHAGQNAIAEIAAARRPAVIVPEDRPHDEQRTTAAVLQRPEWPAVVLERLPSSGWRALLEQAAAQDGELWQGWNDGLGAERAAAAIRRVADAARVPEVVS
ncbi:glycosyltransferase [Herbiconiux sp.]|uniref:glycosyltransferase n=1 Tax=Herbiconiux sp. TaxID=1871186 RepID=UPI0025C6EA18|nr:glycosyltransferase [Herbiconiux sp.]